MKTVPARKPPRRVPRRVFDNAAPGRLGTVVLAHRPEEVSEVRWDDGAEQYVTNEYLGEINDEEGHTG